MVALNLQLVQQASDHRKELKLLRVRAEEMHTAAIDKWKEHCAHISGQAAETATSLPQDSGQLSQPVLNDADMDVRSKRKAESSLQEHVDEAAQEEHVARTARHFRMDGEDL